MFCFDGCPEILMIDIHLKVRKGQVNSKLWLIDNPTLSHSFYNILLCGGWNGVLATLLFNTDLNIQNYKYGYRPNVKKLLVI